MKLRGPATMFPKQAVRGPFVEIWDSGEQLQAGEPELFEVHNIIKR
jgi:hypothetical protein